MATKFVIDGGVVYVPATATINAGDVVSSGRFTGIAQAPAVSGGLCPVQIDGAIECIAGGSVGFGAEVYYSSNGFTATSGGIAVGAAMNAATSGGLLTVKLGK